MVSRVERRIWAFAPGHVTGIFLPSVTAVDPRARGSLGAGLVLELGAWAEARGLPGLGRRRSVTDGSRRRLPISEEVLLRLATSYPGSIDVRLYHELPVGQGFGMSAAGALATAFAVAHVTGASRQRASEIAHLADLYHGGGLGGVAAILGGGLEIRTRPGIPPWGKVLHRPIRANVLVGVVGRPIPSPRVLTNPAALAGIGAAAGDPAGWETLTSLPRFFEASERFTDRAGLAPKAVRDVVRGLRRRGARAAQAMFGSSFFARLPEGRGHRAVSRWLEEHGVRAVELELDRRGARTLPALQRPTRPPQAF